MIGAKFPPVAHPRIGFPWLLGPQRAALARSPGRSILLIARACYRFQIVGQCPYW